MSKNLITKKGLTLAEVRPYVDGKKNFKTNTESLYGVQHYKVGEAYGQYEPLTYAVYSYGKSYPLYVYENETDKWFGNETKSTPTTEKHKKYAEPSSPIHQWHNTIMLHKIIELGYIAVLTQRLEGELPYEQKPERLNNYRF